MAADGVTRAERAFPHAARSVREARQFVSGHLELVDPEVAELAVLLVSELASNAVRHANSEFEVAVATDGGTVNIEVTDSGPGVPQLQERNLLLPSGRGLQLVSDLSREWGVRHEGGGVKTVWFTMELRAMGAAS